MMSFYANFFGGGGRGKGLERGINKEWKDVLKGYPYLEVCMVFSLGLSMFLLLSE